MWCGQNVALTRDLKKARRQVGRVEAKVIKARQGAGSDISPGARKILQETIEENTRTLADFLDTLSNKGTLPDRLSPQKRGPTTGPTSTQLPPPPPSANEEAQAAALSELKGLVERLLELKKHHEARAAEDHRRNNAAATAPSSPPPVCAVCQENKRREAEARRKQKDEEVGALKSRISTLEAELGKAKRELKAVAQREKADGGEAKRSMDRVATLGVQYAKLQKHALFLTMQNEALRDQLAKQKAQQERLRSSVEVAKDMFRRSDGQLEQTLGEHAAEITRLKGVVLEKEKLLRTQMKIKSVVASELLVKRREVTELRQALASTLQARLSTRPVTVEPRPYQVKPPPAVRTTGSVFGSFGRPTPTSPRPVGSPRGAGETLALSSPRAVTVVSPRGGAVTASSE